MIRWNQLKGSWDFAKYGAIGRITVRMTIRRELLTPVLALLTKSRDFKNCPGPGVVGAVSL